MRGAATAVGAGAVGIAGGGERSDRIQTAGAMDWAAVNWVNVGVLSAFAFLAALIGGVLSFDNRLLGAILTALLFAALYIFWNHYPHGVVLPDIKSG
jgi:hypothetical protein